MHRFFLALALLTACSFNSDAESCSGLSFESAWIREPPPVARVAAGYVTIRNTTSNDINITTVDSDCCESTAMHDIVRTGDQSRMVHLSSAIVPASATLVFEPGSRHLMLIGPQDRLRDGGKVTIGFSCSDGSTAPANFRIKRIR